MSLHVAFPNQNHPLWHLQDREYRQSVPIIPLDVEEATAAILINFIPYKKNINFIFLLKGPFVSISAWVQSGERNQPVI